MNTLSIVIVAIFLPGIVATAIIDLLTHHKPWDYFRYGVLSIVLGVISYLGVQLLFSICQLGIYIWDLCYHITPSITFKALSFWGIASAGQLSIHPSEVIFGMLFSIPFSIFCVYVQERRLIYKLMSRFGVSSYIGDKSAFLDGLDYLCEEAGKNRPAIIKIFVSSDNTFVEGEVKHYNENDKYHEISLLNATVSTQDGDYLYHTNYLYLCSEIGGIKFAHNIYITNP